MTLIYQISPSFENHPTFIYIKSQVTSERGTIFINTIYIIIMYYSDFIIYSTALIYYYYY